MQGQIPVAVAPSIPDLPDKYDFDSDADYMKAVSERDEKIRLAVEFESNKKAQEQQNAVIQQNALMEQQRRSVESQDELYKRAEKNGIKQDDLLKAAGAVGQYRLNQGVSDALINDKDGDIMIMHLANNPMEADELSRMSVFEAARQIDTVIREKAQKYKPSSSKAPDPATEIKGKGGGEVGNGLIAGATFE